MFNKEEIVSAKVIGDSNILIQNSDHTTITIDVNNIIELRKQISNLQERLSVLNPEILQFMQMKVKNAGADSLPLVDANIYFSIDMIVNGLTPAMGFSITITSVASQRLVFKVSVFLDTTKRVCF